MACWLARLGAVAVLCSSGVAAQGASRTLPKPLPGHPGNIFLAGEKVVVPVDAAGGSVWRAFDYEDRKIAEAREAGGKLDLGPLPVGWYRLRRDGAAGKEWISLGVIEPLRAPTPRTSPVASDTAMAWFYPTQQMSAVSSLCALAGLNWTRDRLSWGEMEPRAGAVKTGVTRYDASAAALSGAGLRVLQVNHSTPQWANADPKRFPADLRDAYRFYRAMAARWRGKVQAFEPWNEADIDAFGGHTGSEIASMQKASCLGLKAGNPEVIVCQNVFATHRQAQLEDF
ncbi:MAG: hypothetical protein N2689_18415, partial [Verrucomicrobiae bacterium]|nr:hypothetical protein [Verrucomicrobiae bacterium]